MGKSQTYIMNEKVEWKRRRKKTKIFNCFWMTLDYFAHRFITFGFTGFKSCLHETFVGVTNTLELKNNGVQVSQEFFFFISHFISVAFGQINGKQCNEIQLASRLSIHICFTEKNEINRKIPMFVASAICHRNLCISQNRTKTNDKKSYEKKALMSYIHNHRHVHMAFIYGWLMKHSSVTIRPFSLMAQQRREEKKTIIWQKTWIHN